MTAAIVCIAVVTPVLALVQIIALRTGFFSADAAARLWSRMTVRLVGIKVRVHGAPARGRPLLVVSNHVSWTDIFILRSLGELYFVAKSEMAGWPVIGALARLQQAVFVERDRRRGSAEQAGTIAARMAAGDAMVLFAEGTTGDGNTILPFKTSLFGAAQGALEASSEDRVFVQPAAIVYTRLAGLATGRRERARIAWIGDEELFPHITSLFAGGPIDAEVRFGEPVIFSSASNRKDVARRIEAEVRRMAIEISHGV